METSDMYDTLISYVRKYKYGDGDSLSLDLTNLPQANCGVREKTNKMQQLDVYF